MNLKANVLLSMIMGSLLSPLSDHGYSSLFVLQCCQALTAAVCSADESHKSIVPRILFLDNYVYCEDKSNWNWPSGVKMHVMGSLILQAVFRYQNVCNFSLHLF